MPDPLAELRAAFPVARSWIYVNHAAVSPMSVPVREAISAFCHDSCENGSTGFREWLAVRENARGRAARLLGARPEDVAFTTNTSQGLITVAEGLRWAAGDEIVVIEDDFPANHIPWARQERHGVRIVTVPRSEGRVEAGAILARVSERTRVVAVPWVLFDNGFRLDLHALGAALADHPAWLCVDAVQGLGALPLDVEAAGIDVLSASSHKWMLGLEGIGLVWVKNGLLSRLDPPGLSWLSLEDPFHYHPGDPLLRDATVLESATMPTLAIHGLDACLALTLATGLPLMAEQIGALTGHLATGLADAGWRVQSPRDRPEECSGIVVGAPPPGLEAEQAVETLAERRVSVVPRGSGVRFSPHAWNTLDEIDTLLDRLPTP